MKITWFTALMPPVEPTVTVVEAVALAPLEAVAVAVYVVVCEGVTLNVPPVLANCWLVLSTLFVTTTWLAFWAVTVMVELWPEETCVGFAVMVTEGAELVVTVMLSDEEKKKPVVSHARITMACFPAASATDAEREPLGLLALFTESTYKIIPVMACSLSRAAAVNWTGEGREAPLAGEQILTVLSTDDEQLCP